MAICDFLRFPLERSRTFIHSLLMNTTTGTKGLTEYQAFQRQVFESAEEGARLDGRRPVVDFDDIESDQDYADTLAAAREFHRRHWAEVSR